MKIFNKGTDFIPPREELKESVNASLKGLLNGTTLAEKGIHKNMKFIVFLSILGILYIANGYDTERLYKKKIEMEKEVKDLRFESITTSSQLMFRSKQSEVKKRIREVGLELEESKEPPVKIKRR